MRSEVVLFSDGHRFKVTVFKRQKQSSIHQGLGFGGMKRLDAELHRPARRGQRNGQYSLYLLYRPTVKVKRPQKNTSTGDSNDYK